MHIYSQVYPEFIYWYAYSTLLCLSKAVFYSPFPLSIIVTFNTFELTFIMSLTSSSPKLKATSKSSGISLLMTSLTICTSVQDSWSSGPNVIVLFLATKSTPAAQSSESLQLHGLHYETLHPHTYSRTMIAVGM